MKKSVKSKVFAIVLSAVCAASAISAVSIVSSAAASKQTAASSTSAVIVEKTSGSTFTLPMKGEDWNYFADSLNVKVTCDYDYNNSLCNFRFTAVKAGVTNVVLKTQRNDGRWDNTPVRITTGSDLRMNIVQSGNAYVTDKSYTEESSKPAKTTETKSDIKTETKTETSSQTGTVSAQGKTATVTLKGQDWTYFIDSLNIKVSCDFDYNKNICKFNLTAVKPGVTNAVLKTQRADGKWDNTPVRATVGKDLSITVEQTGSTYVTAHSYTE